MFSYWANFNGNYDVAVQAAENDSRVNVLSRPRIQTSHGVEADLFVGSTIPYVDSTTAGAYGGTGVFNSYQQQPCPSHNSTVRIGEGDGGGSGHDDAQRHDRPHPDGHEGRRVLPQGHP